MTKRDKGRGEALALEATGKATGNSTTGSLLNRPVTTEIRNYLDELPRSVVFIATTNRPVKDLQEQLQSRFQVWKFDPIQASLSFQLLSRRYPQLPPAALQTIAQTTSGNVRAALEDAASEMDVFRFRNQQAA